MPKLTKKAIRSGPTLIIASLLKRITLHCITKGCQLHAVAKILFFKMPKKIKEQTRLKHVKKIPIDKILYSQVRKTIFFKQSFSIIRVIPSGTDSFFH